MPRGGSCRSPLLVIPTSRIINPTVGIFYYNHAWTLRPCIIVNGGWSSTMWRPNAVAEAHGIALCVRDSCRTWLNCIVWATFQSAVERVEPVIVVAGLFSDKGFLFYENSYIRKKGKERKNDSTIGYCPRSRYCFVHHDLNGPPSMSQVEQR
ncbi:hypothetical protein AO1008_10842 [Aspergillus oryzae 100-8]|uniref:Uncharacterized protein n=1 Tax=Aspergillus oryzae (strain 3.042) TaxID=1160506 RepID=I8TNQ4_ASPO3|nr:hypothetical protein Ao3042_08180 [Aspergillus oryzae 3.042]KDE84245.1 hypothetical protein AO1008_10842 [Aspergillus oryzae 100-8]|eukprot:EIT75563.1 hypothetical protein Ao3042_08180 [Aspergillus oryzae 3.042]